MKIKAEDSRATLLGDLEPGNLFKFDSDGDLRMVVLRRNTEFHCLDVTPYVWLEGRFTGSMDGANNSEKVIKYEQTSDLKVKPV